MSLTQSARDLLLEHLAQHAKSCPDGGSCREVANVLAFLAHSLGANADDLRVFPARLVEYDMLCKGCPSPRHAQKTQP